MMKKILLILAMVSCVAGVALFVESNLDKSISKNPDKGELRLDMIFGIQVGRDVRNDSQLPPISEAKIVAVATRWFEVDCAAPADSDIGREQARWPEYLRPQALMIDKQSRILVGAYSRSREYKNAAELDAVLQKLVVDFSSEAGCEVLKIRQRDNMFALDGMSQDGRKLTLHITKEKRTADGLYWAVLRFFGSDSCVSVEPFNDLPEVK